MKAAFTSSAWLVLYFFNDVPPSLKYIFSGSEPGYGIIYHLDITSMMWILVLVDMFGTYLFAISDH